MGFRPSKYQKTIFEFVHKSDGSAIIEAVAGSGKTTTIVKSLELLPSHMEILFLAFNKSIAEELKKRVPNNVRAATFHSQGFAAWIQYLGKAPKVDNRKVWLIMRGLMSPNQRDIYGAFVAKMVSLGKSAGIGYIIPNEMQEWKDLYNHHDIFLSEGDEIVGLQWAQLMLEESVDLAKEVIDFDDMLYMPMLRELKFRQYDFIFVDEAQDTNQVQLEFLRRMVPPWGRLIAVGDPYQAIYGFRGADSYAMDNIAQEFSCEHLPLSVSYRCSKAVVKEARKIVPHIEFHKNAPVGEVKRLGQNFNFSDFHNTDAVLCRMTAPLVGFAYELLKNKIPCRILGRDIGQGLLSLVDQMGAKNVDELERNLHHFRAREIGKLLEKGYEGKAQSLSDKVNSLLVMIENLREDQRTVNGLRHEIESIFKDKHNLLTLATIHKSKGLEFERVFVLNPDLMPCEWARLPWQKQQEMNLIYVSTTRAKRALNFIESHPKVASVAHPTGVSVRTP